MSADKIIHPKLSRAIMGAAMNVLNALKPSLDEKAYKSAFAILSVSIRAIPRLTICPLKTKAPRENRFARAFLKETATR
jgi:hypothetical protein